MNNIMAFFLYSISVWSFFEKKSYKGDVINDGLTTNDLVYVPASQSEIILEAANAQDLCTPTILWNQLKTHINQYPYLSSRKGKYAERTGLLLPFYKKMELNFTQDLFVTDKGKRNTIRFTADILNFSNLLNKYRGTFKTTNRTTLLNFIRVQATGHDTGKPVYSFPYLDAGNKIPLTSSFQNSTAQGERFQVQMGIRYIFN